MSHPKANRVLEALAAVIDSLKGARVSYMMIVRLAAELDYVLGE